MYDELSASRDMSIYDKENLMDEEYDATELGRLADERIQSFQADSSQVRHQRILFQPTDNGTLPRYTNLIFSNKFKVFNCQSSKF